MDISQVMKTSVRRFGLREDVLIRTGIREWLPQNFAARDPKVDWRPTVTIDPNHCVGWSSLIKDLRGYDFSDFLLTEEPLRLCDASIPVMRYVTDGNQGYVEIKDGTETTWCRIDCLPWLVERAVNILNHDHLDTKLENVVMCQAMGQGHLGLDRNVFIVDDEDRRALYRRLFSKEKRRFITSGEAREFARRRSRKQGDYYLFMSDYRYHVDKGMYYRHRMYQQIPAYRRLWSIAVSAQETGDRGRLFFELAHSLGDRVMALYQLCDDITDLSLEAQHNGTQWEIVHKLNYFFVLSTGLMDNLAWLTAVTYEANDLMHSRDLVLRYRLDRGQRVPGPIHKLLAAKGNACGYSLVSGIQPLLEALYPVRDSVQHRKVIKGMKVTDVNDGWEKVMISVDSQTVEAISKLAPIMNLQTSEWGLYLAEPDFIALDPYIFVQRSVAEIEIFAEAYLSSLGAEAVLKGWPELLDEALRELTTNDALTTSNGDTTADNARQMQRSS